MGSAPGPALDEQVRQAARASEPERYLSALLAPAPARPDLIALAAFSGEVARVSRIVKEPMMGEVRLQWWRDALEAGAAGSVTGSPVADAVCQAVARHGLPEEMLFSILEAREQELWPGFPAAGRELERYLDHTEGAQMRLVARVLQVPESPAGFEALYAAAQAYGRVRLLALLPELNALGREVRIPGAAGGWEEAAAPIIGDARTWLAELRSRTAKVPRTLLPAILPVALVEPYLKVFEGLGVGMTRQKADISPLTRVWKLWLANMRGRV